MKAYFFVLFIDYYSYYVSQSMSGSRIGEFSLVFAGSSYQRGRGIGSFLGGLFRRILPYLYKGARAVGKEALRAGANRIEDVENNTPLKEAAKARFIESRNNLKNKATEKISNLMKGTVYKSDAKMRVAQFPSRSLNTSFVKSAATDKRRRRTSKKSLSKIGSRKKKR